jgi:hypothetical protein
VSGDPSSRAERPLARGGPLPARRSGEFGERLPKGDNRATGVTVPLGAGGSLSVTYGGCSGGNKTDVPFDVTGYFLN